MTKNTNISLFELWTVGQFSPKRTIFCVCFFTCLKKTVIFWSKRVDGKYDFTFYKNMKTEVLPSYQAAQTIKVREICIIWCPTSIENSTFYKKCVFYINQDAPRLFARNFQQFACFCRNLHVSSRCQWSPNRSSTGDIQWTSAKQRSVTEAYVKQEDLGML